MCLDWYIWWWIHSLLPCWLLFESSNYCSFIAVLDPLTTYYVPPAVSWSRVQRLIGPNLPAGNSLEGISQKKLDSNLKTCARVALLEWRPSGWSTVNPCCSKSLTHIISDPPLSLFTPPAPSTTTTTTPKHPKRHCLFWHIILLFEGSHYYVFVFPIVFFVGHVISLHHSD